MRKYAVLIFIAISMVLSAVAFAEDSSSVEPTVPDFTSGWKLLKTSPLTVILDWKKGTSSVYVGLKMEYENIANPNDRVVVFLKHAVISVSKRTKSKKEPSYFNFGKEKAQKETDLSKGIDAEIVGIVFTRTAKDPRTNEDMLKSVKSFLQVSSGAWVQKDSFIESELLSEPVKTGDAPNTVVGFRLVLGSDYRILSVDWKDILALYGEGGGK